MTIQLRSKPSVELLRRDMHNTFRNIVCQMPGWHYNGRVEPSITNGSKLIHLGITVSEDGFPILVFRFFNLSRDNTADDWKLFARLIEPTLD